MSYEKQEWADYESGATPLSAARLNHMERGIEVAGRFYGWASRVPPAIPPGGSLDNSFATAAAYDVSVRQGQMVFTITATCRSRSGDLPVPVAVGLESLSSGELLSSQNESGWNPGPLYDEGVGPEGGPALVFYPSVEKGAENQLLANDLGGVDGSNFSIIFVPPEGDYTLLIPREFTAEHLYFVGQTDGEFFIANGDNSRAYTTGALTSGEPHLLTLVFGEYTGTFSAGTSRVMVDGEDVVAPGQLWIDEPDVDAVSAIMGISNISAGDEPFLLLWSAVWTPPYTDQYFYLEPIHDYARAVGCPLPPLPED